MANMLPGVSQSDSPLIALLRRISTSTFVTRAVPAVGLALLSILLVVKMAFPSVVTHATLRALVQMRILI